MSKESKKAMGWSTLLITLGVVALVAGMRWLDLLVPAAMLIWYAARPALRSGRS